MVKDGRLAGRVTALKDRRRSEKLRKGNKNELREIKTWLEEKKKCKTEKGRGGAESLLHLKKIGYLRI